MAALNLRLPVIAAPMFLVSGPELVIAACRAGIVGSFPTPNCRTAEELDGWMATITHALADPIAEVLARAIATERVAFVPGGAFFADGSNRNTLRLSFSCAGPVQIDEGMARLGRVLRSGLGQ